MTVTLNLSPSVSSVLEKEATLQRRSVEAIAADALEGLYADETTSELADYEPQAEVVEELRERIQSAQNGDVMPFEDYVEQVRKQRKAT